MRDNKVTMGKNLGNETIRKMDNKAKVRLILKDKTMVAIKGYKDQKGKTGDRKEVHIRSGRWRQQVK